MVIDISQIIAQLSWSAGLKTLANVGVFMAGIVIYSIFVFSLYSLISKRDILKLNLKQYNTTKHPGWKKTNDILLYILEYIIVLPFIVFLWFSAFSLLLATLTQAINFETILIVTIALIGAIRIAAYYNESLAEEMAKLVPFTILGILLVDITTFSGFSLTESFNQIPLLLPQIIYYFVGIVILEIILLITNLFILLLSKPKKQFKANNQKSK